MKMEKVVTSSVYIGEGKVFLNNRLLLYQEKIATFAEFIKALYRKEQLSYPKFYKMDSLCKLGFMAAELLLRNADPGRFSPESLAVVLANSSSSMDTDLIHQESILNRSSYFPSPSVFVYTLPNIVIGEICIRHGIKGENLFLVSERFNPEQLYWQVSELLDNRRAEACICGWTEILENQFRALMMLVERTGSIIRHTGSEPCSFNADTINKLMEVN